MTLQSVPPNIQLIYEKIYAQHHPAALKEPLTNWNTNKQTRVDACQTAWKSTFTHETENPQTALLSYLFNRTYLNAPNEIPTKNPFRYAVNQLAAHSSYLTPLRDVVAPLFVQMSVNTVGFAISKWVITHTSPPISSAIIFGEKVVIASAIITGPAIAISTMGEIYAKAKPETTQTRFYRWIIVPALVIRNYTLSFSSTLITLVEKATEIANRSLYDSSQLYAKLTWFCYNQWADFRLGPDLIQQREEFIRRMVLA